MIRNIIVIFDTVLLVSLLPLFAWFMVCIKRTGEERICAYVALSNRPATGPMIFTAINAISFNRHLRARLLNRDPWALYDPMVLDAIQHPRTEVIGVGVTPGGPEDGPAAVH